jgi:hypothetical protein
MSNRAGSVCLTPKLYILFSAALNDSTAICVVATPIKKIQRYLHGYDTDYISCYKTEYVHSLPGLLQ